VAAYTSTPPLTIPGPWDGVAGAWQRVDVAFSVFALSWPPYQLPIPAIGWAHWLIAGHTLPLPPTTTSHAKPSPVTSSAAQPKASVADQKSAAGGGDARTPGTPRAPRDRCRRLQTRAAVVAAVRWLVAMSGRTEALADVAGHVTSVVLAADAALRTRPETRQEEPRERRGHGLEARPVARGS
jgi:hypothetical protein